MKIENENKTVSRKKFIGWGVGLASLLTVPSFLFGQNKKLPKKGKMVKMLTQDGKLVEVEESILTAATKRKKAGNKEIFHWMKNPSKKP